MDFDVVAERKHLEEQMQKAQQQIGMLGAQLNQLKGALDMLDRLHPPQPNGADPDPPLMDVPV